MAATQPTDESVRFGVFQLDLGTGDLTKSGRHVRLQPQPSKVLGLLTCRAGQLVTREELKEQIWGSETFVDFEHGLNFCIRQIRAALDDNADTPRFVETVPRRGYRFIAPVQKLDQAGQESGASPGIPFTPPSKRSFPRVSMWLGVISAGLLTVFVFLLATTNKGGLRHWPFRNFNPGAIRSVAVLPLRNLSADPAQEYFADGITEALITDLAKIGSLRVISHTSMMQYKDTKKPLSGIASELDVDAILEGGVVLSSDRVRITAQLIHAPTDQQIWAETYERDLRDILALQDEVARAIANEVRIKLTPQEESRLANIRPVNPEAHEAYLKGRYYSNKRTEKELKKSVEYFQRAIETDPNYALAYSGLADGYTLLGFQGGLPSKDALSRAKAAALKAIELDDTLAEAHASLAFIAETYEWDWSTAEREFKRTLELNPGYAEAHNWYAGYLMYLGRFEEGIAEARRARELDPLSLAISNALGGRLFLAGRDNDAREQFQKTLEMDPNFAPAHNLLAWAYLRKGMRQEAIAEFQKEIALSGTDPDLSMDLGYAYAISGRRDRAKKILAKLKKKRETGFVPPTALAIVSGALGDKDQAFTWLEEAYKERDPNMTYLKVGPRFAPLRSDQRFQGLLRRMGLLP